MELPKVQPGISIQLPGLLSESKPTDSASQITETFGNLLESLSLLEFNSDHLIQQLAAGEDVDVHQVMIAMEETDISFRVALAIRDKLVEAYREVMRMSV